MQVGLAYYGFPENRWQELTLANEIIAFSHAHPRDTYR